MKRTGERHTSSGEPWWSQLKALIIETCVVEMAGLFAFIVFLLALAVAIYLKSG